MPCPPLKLRPVRDESLSGFAVGLKLGHPEPLRLQAKKQCRKVLGKGLERQSAEEQIKMKKRESSATVDKRKEQTTGRAGSLAGSSVQMLILL